MSATVFDLKIENLGIEASGTSKHFANMADSDNAVVLFQFKFIA